MKKLILLLCVLAMSASITAQTHNIIKTFTGGYIIRDSLRYTNLGSLTPRSDSVHIINLGLQVDFFNLILLADTNTTRDSLKLTSGVINYSATGTVIDTTWADEVWMKDSVGTAVTRCVSVTTNPKSYLSMNPAIQLLKIAIVNYRAAVPTRVVHYRLVTATRKEF